MRRSGMAAGGCAGMTAGFGLAAILREHANGLLGFAFELRFVHGESGRRGKQRKNVIGSFGTATQGPPESVGDGIATSENEQSADGGSGDEFPPAGMKKPLANERERRVGEKAAMFPRF